MQLIASTTIPNSAAVDLIQKPFQSAKSNEPNHHQTAQSHTVEKDIWKQLETTYSWVGL